MQLFALVAVYDVTIGYKTRCPSFLDNVYGTEPSEVHIHIRRISQNQIPNEEKEINAWLMNTFQIKDQLLGEFYSRGHFPNEGTEKEFNTMKCLKLLGSDCLHGRYVFVQSNVYQVTYYYSNSFCTE